MFLSVVLVLTLLHFVNSDDAYAMPENLNVDEALQNDRLTNNYINCLLDKGKCTPDGENLKKTIPEALQNDCKKCNAQVKDAIAKVIKHVSEKKPESWKLLEAKYDPEGLAKKRNKKEFEEAGLNI